MLTGLEVDSLEASCNRKQGFVDQAKRGQGLDIELQLPKVLAGSIYFFFF